MIIQDTAPALFLIRGARSRRNGDVARRVGCVGRRGNLRNYMQKITNEFGVSGAVHLGQMYQITVMGRFRPTTTAAIAVFTSRSVFSRR